MREARYSHPTDEGPCWHDSETLQPEDPGKHARHLQRQFAAATDLCTIVERECGRVEAMQRKYPDVAQHYTGFQVYLARRCDGKTARIAPGLSGEVLFHGDKHVPSIVFIKVQDARRWLESEERP